MKVSPLDQGGLTFCLDKHLLSDYNAVMTKKNAVLFQDAEVKRKRCPSCTETLPISEFRNDKTTHDGYSVYCKDCRQSYEAERRASRRANMQRIKEMGLYPQVKEILAKKA